MGGGCRPVVGVLVGFDRFRVVAASGFDYAVESRAVGVCSLYAAEIFAVGVVDIVCCHGVSLSALYPVRWVVSVSVIILYRKTAYMSILYTQIFGFLRFAQNNDIKLYILYST